VNASLPAADSPGAAGERHVVREPLAGGLNRRQSAMLLAEVRLECLKVSRLWSGAESEF
jgi:hypothetical protein